MTGRYLKCTFAFYHLNNDVNLRTLTNTTEFPGEKTVPTIKGFLQSLLHDYETKRGTGMKRMWTEI